MKSNETTYIADHSETNTIVCITTGSELEPIEQTNGKDYYNFGQKSILTSETYKAYTKTR